jgi:hypothetical protein
MKDPVFTVMEHRSYIGLIAFILSGSARSAGGRIWNCGKIGQSYDLFAY